MQISDMTTYDDVRIALGMSDEELEDGEIELESMQTQLEEALLEVHPDLLTTYEALPDPDDQSANQTRFFKLTRLYSTYAVAWIIINTSLKMLAFQKVGDGRASAERVKPAMDDLKLNVNNQLLRILALLLKALGLLGPTIPTLVPAGLIVIGSVGIASDPVTG